MRHTDHRSLDRRSLLGRLAAGLGLAAVPAAAVAAPAAPAPFVPARHAADDWLDTLGSKHRFVFDTTTTAGFTNGILFANNFLTASQTGYGLADADNGVVVVARHGSTAYAYNEAMWKKYGATIATVTELPDYAAKDPTVNPFTLTATNLPTRGITIESLVKRGVHFAVCGMATRRIATEIAKQVNSTPDAIVAELSANLAPNAHLAAAGILAVNRAQERGYTLATA